MVGGEKRLECAAATGKAPVIDLTDYGIFKCLGKGQLPKQPVVVKARYISKLAEKKIKDIEEELRVVGANLQQLEVGEEKTIQREEASQNEILELLYKLKMSDYRGENAEMNIQRLNVRIDQVEEDLLSETYKIKK